jgi:hypothetical protein
MENTPAARAQRRPEEVKGFTFRLPSYAIAVPQPGEAVGRVWESAAPTATAFRR